MQYRMALQVNVPLGERQLQLRNVQFTVTVQIKLIKFTCRHSLVCDTFTPSHMLVSVYTNGQKVLPMIDQGPMGTHISHH